MSRPKPLFVMGNKRSGTTVLANLLNAHPRVFLPHEADTAGFCTRHDMDSLLAMRLIRSTAEWS